MVGRRHRHDPAGTDEALCLFDFVADLLGIRAIRPLHGVDQNIETIVGVTAERGDGLLRSAFVGRLILNNDLLLRITIWQLVADKQCRSWQTNALR